LGRIKRALITEKIKVENITGLNVISETLTPEPIPLDVKVILIGTYTPISSSIILMMTLKSYSK